MIWIFTESCFVKVLKGKTKQVITGPQMLKFSCQKLLLPSQAATFLYLIKLIIIIGDHERFDTLTERYLVEEDRYCW